MAEYNDLNCKNCDAVLKFDETMTTVSCEYCGSTYSVSELLQETDEMRLRKLKAKQEKDKAEKDAQLRAIEEKKAREREEAIAGAKFRGQLRSKVLVGWAVICAILVFGSFSDGDIGAGFIALIQVVLAVFAWLVGARKLANVRPVVGVICAILTFVLVIPWAAVTDASDEYTPSSTVVELHEDFVWPDYGMAAHLPNPEASAGTIQNADDYLSATVGNYDRTQFNSYVKACVEAGFAEDCYSNDDYFWGYDKDGCYISLDFDSDKQHMSIFASAADEESIAELEEAIEEEDVQENIESFAQLMENIQPAESAETVDPSLVTPEFKETMDKYEAFFVSFVEFTNSGYSSDSSSSSFKYLQFVMQAVMVLDEIDDIDVDSLSDADKAYFIEVNSRILQLLVQTGLASE